MSGSDFTVPTIRTEGRPFEHAKQVVRTEAAKFSRALGHTASGGKPLTSGLYSVSGGSGGGI